MGNLSTNRTPVQPTELINRWMTHRRTMADAALETARAAATPSLAPSGDDAARVVLAALAQQREEDKAPGTPAPPGTGSAVGTAPSEVTGLPTSTASPHAAPVPTARAVPTTPLPRTVTTRPPAAPAPGLVVFSPRRGARHVLTLLCVPVALALAVSAYVAWDARTTTAYAVAGGLLVALLALWSARDRNPATVVSIEDGVLRIARGVAQHRFPLTAPYPPIDVLGEPGDRGWKVLVQRKGMAPYAITARMVDPAAFTEAIRRFRPNA